MASHAATRAAGALPQRLRVKQDEEWPITRHTQNAVQWLPAIEVRKPDRQSRELEHRDEGELPRVSLHPVLAQLPLHVVVRDLVRLGLHEITVRKLHGGQPAAVIPPSVTT